ncbi:telomerase reverse transcriptase isoform X2 [Monomorium pharaonis]|uniref:telomerase reverse transcriptase isoform X2 n=1 Tax=Monomorium pharaonis TaxID=307658 RepID=UPI001747BB3B|nr:telomerase reverse transcriptase isoform X2 [Monomorium pharaonis]
MAGKYIEESKSKLCVKKKIFNNIQCSSGTKASHPVPFYVYNSKIKLFKSRSCLRKVSRTTAKIAKYHILENKNVGLWDICHRILSTDIGLAECYKNINLDSVIPALLPILEAFRDKHNRFDYFNKLKYTIKRNSQRTCKTQYKTQFKHQINVLVLQAFFSLLMYEVVPLELFGTSRNRKSIKYMIFHLLKTIPVKISIIKSYKRTIRKTNTTGGILDLEPLFKRLDISQIQWLHSIDNTVQWIVILKLLHWFFKQYIIKILHKYIVLKIHRKQWVYITKDDWCNMQETFIKEKENTLNLVPCTKLNKKYIGTYKFIPSSSGLRPLYITRNNIKEKYDDTEAVLRFLQQLYVTYFDENGMSTVPNCVKAIKNFISKKFKEQSEGVKETNRNTQKLYYVRCDIQDAFEKLYDIIEMSCNELYEKYGGYLAVRLSILNTKKRQSKMKKYTVQVLEHYLKNSKKNIPLSKEKPKLVQINNLTMMIKKFIFQRKVKFNGQIYSIKQYGVPQGAKLSPILSDIYYQDMIKKMFSEYLNHGLLTRYADDILFITQNEKKAARFLKIIQEEGVSDYNVKFNKDKIETNVGQPYKPTKVTFLKQKFLI